MILYYAPGGGLGHVTRARAVLHTLECESPAVILSSSSFTASLRVADGIPIQALPDALLHDREGHRAWLAQFLTELQPAVIYIDAFPAGIVAEFCDFPVRNHVPVHYVARRLRWSSYASQLREPLPTFHTTFCLEPLEVLHHEFINTRSTRISPLSLIDLPCHLSLSERTIAEGLSTSSAEPFWLVVHSGSSEEVSDLVHYAVEMRQYEGSHARLVVAALEESVPLLPPYAHGIGLFPARALFPFAARVISGCGFNIMRQMASFRHKHYYLPFPRRFDDQYWRAAYWRACRSDREYGIGLQVPSSLRGEGQDEGKEISTSVTLSD